MKRWAELITAGRYIWKRHTLNRMVERKITQRDVLEVLQSGCQIETYASDQPVPSALYYKMVNNRPLHEVAAIDEQRYYGYIITAYEPDAEHFMPDFLTRRIK